MALFTDIFEDVTKHGKKIPTSEYLKSGKYPIVDQGQNDIAGYTNEEQGLFTDVPVVIFGDHTRAVKYVDTLFFLGADGVKVLKSKINDVNYKYLYYAVSAVHIPNTGYNRHFKWLKEADISIPSIENQHKIVKALDKLTSLINLHNNQLSKLEELVKARFVELFGDVLTNEKSWKTSIWNDVLTIKNGKNQKQVENPTGQYPICGSGGIMGYADNYISETNSVIIGRKGNINKPILMRERYWNVDTAFGLEPNNEILLVDYLFLFCVLFDFERLNKAVTIPSLTKADLLKIEMPIPPIDLQSQFATFVKQIDKSKFAVQQSLDKLETLKKSLMQKYFG